MAKRRRSIGRCGADVRWAAGDSAFTIEIIETGHRVNGRKPDLGVIVEIFFL